MGVIPIVIGTERAQEQSPGQRPGVMDKQRKRCIQPSFNGMATIHAPQYRKVGSRWLLQ